MAVNAPARFGLGRLAEFPWGPTKSPNVAQRDLFHTVHGVALCVAVFTAMFLQYYFVPLVRSAQ